MVVFLSKLSVLAGTVLLLIANDVLAKGGITIKQGKVTVTSSNGLNDQSFSYVYDQFLNEFPLTFCSLQLECARTASLSDKPERVFNI